MKRLPNLSAHAVEQLPDKRALAKRYGVSTRTVDRWVSTRKIPHLRLGNRCIRFRWAAVEAALNRLVVEEIK
jgi:excisionase family DNA binding protein